MNLGLSIALLALTSLALAMLLVPLLWRRDGTAAREAYNLAVYREQLAEVERDLGRDLLSPEQAEEARTEVGRRILALHPGDAEPRPNAARPAVAALAVLLLPIAVWATYLRIGSPLLPDQPFAERGATPTATAQNAPHIDINEAVGRLAAHLKQHPEDLTGWLLLARSELGLGRYQEGAEAYRRAADLSGHRADIMGAWGEAQVLVAGGTVTPAAREAFEAGVKDPEAAPRSRYYLALAQLQQGDAKGALQAWTELAAESPKDAEWLPLVRQRIAQAASVLGIDPATLKEVGGETPAGGGGPSEAAVAATARAIANSSPEERRAMISAMVSQLAERLETQPEDIDGWARLGRSYLMLNEPDKARDAYRRALQLKPGDPTLQQGYAAAEAALKGAGTAK